MPNSSPASTLVSGARAVSKVSVWVLIVPDPASRREGANAARISGEETGGAQHAIGLDDLFQPFFRAPVATIRVGMKTLHEFLIPRLDLDQGGVVGQLQRVHGDDLKPCQLPFRASYAGIAILCKHRMAVIHIAQAGLPHAGLGGALAQGPGRPVAGERFFTEPPDVVVTHVLEEIPGLIVGAGVRRTKPDIFRKILG